MAKTICSVVNCGRDDINGHGLCHKHYKRWYKHGDPLTSLINRERGYTYSGNGYKQIRINGKRIFEHVYLVQNNIGRTLLKSEVVHHINEIKDDNRLENLQLMTRAEHTILHSKQYRRPENTDTHKYCPGCKTTLLRNAFGLCSRNLDNCQDYCKACKNRSERASYKSQRLI